VSVPRRRCRLVVKICSSQIKKRKKEEKKKSTKSRRRVGTTTRKGGGGREGGRKRGGRRKKRKRKRKRKKKKECTLAIPSFLLSLFYLLSPFLPAIIPVGLQRRPAIRSKDGAPRIGADCPVISLPISGLH